MISTQVFSQFFLAKSTVVRSLKHNVQEWIRKEIVDDDPYEQEAFLFKKNKVQ